MVIAAPKTLPTARQLAKLRKDWPNCTVHTDGSISVDLCALFGVKTMREFWWGKSANSGEKMAHVHRPPSHLK